MRHDREWIRQIDVHRFLEDATDHVFKQIADFLFFNKRHFAVDLGKLRLAVCTQIFVAETFRDLVITVETGNHQQLFEQLWRLRQSEKFTRIDTGRNQIIAGTFRCRFRQHRCFDIDKAVFIQIFARFHRNLVTQTQIVLHLRTAQIENTVRQTGRFGEVFIIQLERRGNRRIQHFQFFTEHFNTSRGQVFIDRALWPFANDTGHLKTEFVTNRFSHLENVRPVRIADNLNQTFTVSQVDKYDPAMITAPVHPAA